MKRNAFFVFLLVFLCSVSVFSQAKRFTVDLIVDGDDEKDVQSYLARELRSLGDVDVVENGDLTVSVVIAKTKSTTGQSLGYAMMAHFLDFGFCGNKAQFSYLDSILVAGGSDSLRRLSENIITAFDTDVLEKRRKAK